MRRYRVCALITCHNRREKTLQCLRALFANCLPEGVSLHVVLVDDGSSDGTSAAIVREFPQVEVLRGDGTLFWNRGMHKAFARALLVGFDAYFWLNDDTVLCANALSRLYDTSALMRHVHGRGAIVVGSTESGVGGIATYGGVRRAHNFRPLRFSLISPTDEPQPCDSMNGNCVLVTHEIAAVVGNLEPGFAHAMGDIDYGLRAVKAGFDIWVTPGFVGVCDRNAIAGTYQDRSLSISARWKKIRQPKGLPIASWLLFTRRHAGNLWPLHFIWPYIRIWL